MTFVQAIARCYGRMFQFSDRAPRSEYWWFYLWQFVLMIGLQFTVGASLMANPEFIAMLQNPDTMEQWIMDDDNLRQYGVAIGIILFIGFIMPNWAVTVRRLHDTNRSGWRILWPMLVSVGGGFLAGYMGANGDPEGTGMILLVSSVLSLILSIMLLVWLIQRGTDGDNHYGPDPLGGLAPAHPAFADPAFSGKPARSDSIIPNSEPAAAGDPKQRKAAAQAYYRNHVLPSIQKGNPNPDY